MHVRYLVVTMLSLLPLTAIASEFMDDDVLPKQEQVVFDKDKVYFYSVIDDPIPHRAWYSFDRKTHQIAKMEGKPPVPDSNTVPRVQLSGPCEFNLQTSDGKTYGACLPDCEDGMNKPGTLTDLDTGKSFFAHTPGCAGPGTVETVGDKLLVGAWDSEDYSLAVSPVVVLDGKTHTLLKSIDFAADVIRVDPIAPQVWLVGAEGVMLLDQDLNLKQHWYFYRGFDPVDHASKLLVSGEPRKSDPFAAMAWDLHVSDAQGWYKAVQALPPETRQGVTMYSYFMGMTRLSDQRYPALQTLIPFLIDHLRAHVEDVRDYRAFPEICRYPDPQVDALMVEMMKSADQYAAQAGKSCAELRSKLKLGAH